MGRLSCTLIIFAFSLGCVYAIRWKDCGSTLAKVKDVMVSGCEKSTVCDLPRGSTVNFTVDFRTSSGAEDAKSVVHGIIEGVPLPFPVSPADACKDPSCGLNCPLKDNKSYSFHPGINVLKEYPKLKVVVKWELKDQTGKDIFCIMVPAQIVDGKKPKEANRTKPRSNKTPKLMTLL